MVLYVDGMPCQGNLRLLLSRNQGWWLVWHLRAATWGIQVESALSLVSEISLEGCRPVAVQCACARVCVCVCARASFAQLQQQKLEKLGMTLGRRGWSPPPRISNFPLRCSANLGSGAVTYTWTGCKRLGLRQKRCGG